MRFSRPHRKWTFAPVLSGLCAPFLVTTFVSSTMLAQYNNPRKETVTVRELKVPRAAWIELQKSWESSVHGDTVAGELHLERALKIYPDFANAWAWRGQMRSEAGDFTGACTELQKAITLDPDLRLAYVALGSVYNNVGRWDEARHVLELSMRFGTSYHVYHELARAAAGQGKLQEALQFSDEAAKTSPPEAVYVQILRSRLLQSLAIHRPAESNCQLKGQAPSRQVAC